MVTAPTLAHRIAYPTPQARSARVHLRRSRSVQRARVELGRMTQRMQALAANQQDLRELTRIAEQAAPNKTDEAAWPGDVQELADKIQRQGIYSQGQGGLYSFETPVRDHDRQMLKKGLPPGIEADMDDPFPFPWKPLR